MNARVAGITTAGKVRAMGETIDRAEVNRALAKALAYAQCGKRQDAEAWAAELVRLLGCAGILRSTLTVSEAMQAGTVRARSTGGR